MTVSNVFLKAMQYSDLSESKKWLRTLWAVLDFSTTLQIVLTCLSTLNCWFDSINKSWNYWDPFKRWDLSRLICHLNCDLVHWVHHSWQKIKPFLSLFTLLTFDSHDEIGTHQTCCSSNTVLLSCQAQPYQLLTTSCTHMHWGQPIFWSAAPYLGWVGFVKDLFVSICTQLYISQ